MKGVTIWIFDIGTEEEYSMERKYGMKVWYGTKVRYGMEVWLSSERRHIIVE